MVLFLFYLFHSKETLLPLSRKRSIHVCPMATCPSLSLSPAGPVAY